MAKYRLAQCDISTAVDNYSDAVKIYNDAELSLRTSVTRLIRMLNHLDYNLLKLKRQMQFTYIDGEDVSFYHVHSVKVEEDDTIIVYANDDFDEDVVFELNDLPTDEIYCLGALLFDQYQQKYGKVMTYKDMVEASKKIV